MEAADAEQQAGADRLRRPLSLSVRRVPFDSTRCRRRSTCHSKGNTHVAVHYHTQTDAANETLAQVRARGAKGCVIQADVTQPEHIERMFDQIKREFGRLDIFVSNARPELAAFYQPPMALTLHQWNAAIDSQAQACLLGSQAAASS